MTAALRKALDWAATFSHYCLLNSNGFAGKYGRYDVLLAVGAGKLFEPAEGETGVDFLNRLQEEKTWLFGYTPYASANAEWRGKSVFFKPENLLVINGEGISVLHGEYDPDLAVYGGESPELTIGTFAPGVSRAEYLEDVRKVRDYIKQGEVYELNYCLGLSGKGWKINPVEVYTRLNNYTRAPFSALARANNNYIISASPERFACRYGTGLVCQPMKGTAPRDTDDEIADTLNALHLKQSEKERAENVMIVDLTRNELAKIARGGTVEVEALFEVIPYTQAHQMISTVKCKVDPGIRIGNIFESLYPMGSMTGAPKVRAMELIDEIERFERNGFSGCVGYLTPDADFDFNVAIRTIFYDGESGMVSGGAGSAITWQSDPLGEYEECLLKAAALQKALLNN